MTLRRGGKTIPGILIGTKLINMEILISARGGSALGGKSKKCKIRLILFQDKKEVDFFEMPDEYRLSEELLPGIDRLIRKNKLKTEDIKKVLVESDQGDNFTTTRIAKSMANAWNWGQKADK